MVSKEMLCAGLSHPGPPSSARCECPREGSCRWMLLVLVPGLFCHLPFWGQESDWASGEKPTDTDPRSACTFQGVGEALQSPAREEAPAPALTRMKDIWSQGWPVCCSPRLSGQEVEEEAGERKGPHNRAAGSQGDFFLPRNELQPVHLQPFPVPVPAASAYPALRAVISAEPTATWPSTI